jgi:hypothetical protein
MTEVRLNGPVFDARGPAIMQDMKREGLHRVAGQALSNVQTNLDASIRHPTPYYETQIRLDERGDSAVVDDRGVIYGPWLEGVGSRNKSTRFKGYFSFRRAVQTLQQQTPELLRAVAEHAVRRFNS